MAVSNPPLAVANLDFESALDELDTLVRNMESGELSLDASIAAYRRGAELARHCQAKLASAEQEIKRLEGDLLKTVAAVRTAGRDRVNARASAIGNDPVVAFESWMRDIQQRFERAADRILPAADLLPQRLHQAMRYAVLDGGKRVRPLLVYASGEANDARLDDLDRTALALEYVHAYSLVHDDLPCMDNDVLRRGKPTVHVAFDEATAMLAGDALQAEAFKVIADGHLTPARKAAIMGELAHAAGTEGMCGGQAIDLAAVGQPMSLAALEQMHRMKTGALLRAAVRMGALSGSELDPRTEIALVTYAGAIGLAFQVVDDVLDVEGSTAELGKTAGKDAAANKPTYVSLLGLAAAKARAIELKSDALAALAPLGTRATRLRELAEFIVGRTH